jgi:hypothetical protein
MLCLCLCVARSDRWPIISGNLHIHICVDKTRGFMTWSFALVRCKKKKDQGKHTPEARGLVMPEP